MHARLILIGSCLLLSACSGPWLRADGEATSGLLTDLDNDRQPSVSSSPPRTDGKEPLRPIVGASYNSASYNSTPVPRFDAPDAPTRPMTVDEVLQYALQHHPMLRVRQHEVEAAKGRLSAAGVLPNPDFVLDVDRNVDDDTIQLSGRLIFGLPTAGKLGLREEVAAAAVTRAKLALHRETKDVLSRSAQAAIDVLYYKQLAQLYERMGKLTTKAATFKAARLQTGQVGRGMVRTLEGFVVQADAAEIEQERLKTLRQLKSAQMILAQAIGVAIPRPVDVKGELVEEWLPDIPLEAVLDELRFSGPEIVGQRAAIQQSRWREELENANATPDLGIGPRWSETLNDPNGSYGLRLRREIAISDWNQGDILASEAMVAREEAMLEAVSLETLGDAATVYAELAPLRSQLEDYMRHIEPLLNETEHSVNEAIDSKLIDPSSLNAHIRRLVRLRVDHLRARYRYAQLHMRLVAASSRAIRERRMAADPN